MGFLVSDYFGDLSDPDTIPTGVDITGFGNVLDVSAAGFWSHTPTPDSGPGGKGAFEQTMAQYEVFGVSLLGTDLNTLAGVFLPAAGPDPNNIPPRLSTGDVMTSPVLGQAFAIGASLSGISVPTGATTLYLGLHDGFEWTNNSGSVDVTVTGRDGVITEPGSVAIWTFMLAIGTVAAFRVRK